MRRLAVVFMVSVLVLPSVALAAGKSKTDSVARASTSKKSKSAKKKKASSKAGTEKKSTNDSEFDSMFGGGAEKPASQGASSSSSSSSEPEDPPSPPPAAVAAPTPAASKSAAAADAPKKASTTPSASSSDLTARLFNSPKGRSHAHRYAFAAAGFLGVTAFAFGYWAQGEAKRAETMQSAPEAARVLDGAHKTAATANLLYGVAGAALVYGVVMEFLPQKTAEKASLTFHF